MYNCYNACLFQRNKIYLVHVSCLCVSVMLLAVRVLQLFLRFCSRRKNDKINFFNPDGNYIYRLL